MVDHILGFVPVPDKLNEFLCFGCLPVINADEVEALNAAGVSVLLGYFFTGEEEDTDDLEMWLGCVFHDQEVTEGVFFTFVAADALEEDSEEVLRLPVNFKVRGVFVG